MSGSWKSLCSSMALCGLVLVCGCRLNLKNPRDEMRSYRFSFLLELLRGVERDIAEAQEEFEDADRSDIGDLIYRVKRLISLYERRKDYIERFNPVNQELFTVHQLLREATVSRIGAYKKLLWALEAPDDEEVARRMEEAQSVIDRMISEAERQESMYKYRIAAMLKKYELQVPAFISSSGE